VTKEMLVYVKVNISFKFVFHRIKMEVKGLFTRNQKKLCCMYNTNFVLYDRICEAEAVLPCVTWQNFVSRGRILCHTPRNSCFIYIPLNCK
jgi:hypothetical protein